MTEVLISPTTSYSKIKLWEDRWRESYIHAISTDPEPSLRDISIASEDKVLKAVRFIKYLYDRYRIYDAFNFYINFIRKYAKTVDLKRIEVFQFEDMFMSVSNFKSLWLRTRRGGKTRDMALVNCFWAIVGKECLIFTPQADQQKQMIEYFLANPFYSHSSRDFFYIKGTTCSVEISNLTLGKSASKGKDCISYDEGAKVPKGYLIYDYYKFSRVVIAAKLWEGDKHLLFASTAARNTAIEEEYLAMMRSTPEMVSVHPYTDCWWITEEWVQSERDANLNDPWFVDQEYLTLFVNRHGSVFDNVVEMRYEDMKDHKINYIGEDINKKEMLIFCHISEDKRNIYIMAEMEVDWTKDEHCYDFIKPLGKFVHRGKEYQFDMDFFFEVEAMGYNEKEAVWIGNHVPNVYLNYDWKKIGIVGDRVTTAKRGTIYCDQIICRNIYQDLINCIYHAYNGTYVKDAAHPNHWLDAFLHAIGVKMGRFIINVEAEKREIALPHHMKKR